LLVSLTVAALAVLLYQIKPGPDDYRRELEVRAATVWARKPTVAHIVGRHPLAEMVVVRSPHEALRRTRVKDYFVVSFFETEFETLGLRRRVRVLGLCGSFFVIPDRESILTAHDLIERGEAVRLAQW